MSNLQIYRDVAPDDEAAWLDFMGAHEIRHKVIADAVAAAGKQTQSFPLADHSKADPQWLYDHYQMHIGLTVALGLPPPPDLASMDLENHSQFSDWLLLHSQVHDLVDAALGLT